MRRQHVWSVWMMALALGVALAETSLAAGESEGQGARRGPFRAEQTDRETRTLALGASGIVTLQNLSGDITVRAGSGRDVTVTIVRRARGRTEADARRGLERVTVSVDERGDRAHIETIVPRERNAPYSVSVDYELAVPAATSVTLQTISGDISITGVTGDLALTTTSGDVSVRDARRVSRARTTSGDVHLINIESDGTLEAGTISGTVLVEQARVRRLVLQAVSGTVTARSVSCERAELGTTSGTVEYAGPLMAGGQYELQNHSGDIRFAPTGDRGFALRATTFSGEIRPDRGVRLEITRRDRRQLHGTVGDASAVVALRTFSGDIHIVRQ